MVHEQLVLSEQQVVLCVQMELQQMKHIPHVMRVLQVPIVKQVKLVLRVQSEL